MQLPPLPVEVNNHEEYEVEKVLDLRYRWGTLEYFIHCRGYNINECIWEPTTNVINVPQKVQEFC